MLKSRLLTLGLAAFFFGTQGGATPKGIEKPRLIEGQGKREHGFFVAGASGATYALPGGVKLRLNAGSSLRVLHEPQRLRLDPGKITRTYTVILRQGRVDVDVPEDASSAALITAPHAQAAIVTRGHAVVAVSSERVVVANPSGQTQVRDGQRYVNLPEGRARFLEWPQAPREQSLTTPPSSVRGKQVYVAATGSTSIDGVSWSSVSNAQSYRVELRKGEKLIATESGVSTRMRGTFSRLEPGGYQLCVRAIDRFGLEGRCSAPLAIQVVGIQLPDGAYVSRRGSVQLGQGQSLRFQEVNDLEMTYGGAKRYFPATDSVSLYRNQPTMVYLRQPGSSSLARLRLEPRGVHAEVTMGPIRAIWPDDDVTVSIRLRDRNGEGIPEWLEVTPKVLLGIDPLDVRFKRSGDTLSATIPGRKGTGPWVLRVEVSDQFGIPLGRNFLEVVRRPKPRSAKTRERVATR